MNERECRRVVGERSGLICEFCFAARATDMHHRVNRSQGGAWEPANIVHLCRGCHHRVTVGPAWGLANGLHVPGEQAPEEVPIVHAGKATWLSVDGTKRMTYVDTTG